MKRRTRKQWYTYHLTKAQEGARSEVMTLFSNEVEATQRSRDEVRQALLNAQQAEPWVSRLLGFFGIDTPYRQDVLNPIRMDVLLTTRALDDVLERRRIELDAATRRGTDNYLEARELRKEEERARAERVAQWKHERRIRYLEQSPALRSAARLLKQLLMRQQSPDGISVTCFYCGVIIPVAQSHLEHKRPISRGGDNRHGNLALSCSSCNLKKGRKTHEEFMRECGRVEA